MTGAFLSFHLHRKSMYPAVIKARQAEFLSRFNKLISCYRALFTSAESTICSKQTILLSLAVIACAKRAEKLLPVAL
jgi:hypothetical protein